MNFLGHAYLSFDDKEILVGNMISDFVKGKKQYDYIAGIHKGIILHRQIDAYTDVHPAIKEAKEIFRADYRLLSGAIVDIIFDHFLARDRQIFPASSLQQLVRRTYAVLEEYSTHLPLHFVAVFGYMKAEDWLFNYQYTTRIEKSLSGLVRRSSFFHEAETAHRLFQAHYLLLQDCYLAFIKDVKMFAKEQYKTLVQ